MVSKLPYGNAEDPNLWAMWYSMLDFTDSSENKLKSLASRTAKRIKKLAIKSTPKKIFKNFDIEKISNKHDFEQLLAFELFDFHRHTSNSADLFNMFSF